MCIVRYRFLVHGKPTMYTQISQCKWLQPDSGGGSGACFMSLIWTHCGYHLGNLKINHCFLPHDRIFFAIKWSKHLLSLNSSAWTVVQLSEGFWSMPSYILSAYICAVTVIVIMACEIFSSASECRESSRSHDNATYPTRRMAIWNRKYGNRKYGEIETNPNK